MSNTPQDSWIQRNSKRLVPLGVLAAAMLVALLLVKTKPQADPVKVTEKSWLVAVMAAEQGEWQPRLPLYGRMESLIDAHMSAAIAAEVMAVEVLEGDLVSEGQILMRLDDRDVQFLLAQREAELAEAEAKIQSLLSRHAANLESLPREKQLLALAEQEVARLGKLVKQQVGAQSALDTARQSRERQAIAVTAREQSVQEHTAALAELEARRDKAQALRDQAALELDRATVKAPFDGRIARIPASQGQRVRVGDALVQLYRADALVLRAQIPLRHLSTVRSALAAGATLTIEGMVDQTPVSGHLLRLSSQVANNRGGVEALFAIEQGREVLQLGRFLTVSLQLPPQSGLIAVPYETLYGTDRIYRVVEGRLEGVAVERIGETVDTEGSSRLLIRAESLSPGEPIVTTQIPNAMNGLKVSIAK